MDFWINYNPFFRSIKVELINYAMYNKLNLLESLEYITISPLPSEAKTWLFRYLKHKNAITKNKNSVLTFCIKPGTNNKKN